MLINMDDYKHTKMRVLFLCIGNSCRSQMAEALLRKHAPNRFSAFSAGIEPSTVNPYTIRVLQEMGVDTSDLFSKSLSKFFKAPAFDYLITVCSDAEERCPVFPGAGKRLHWSFEDPAKFIGSDQEKLAQFRVIRDQIDQCISDWLKEFPEKITKP